jgi:hypothetical protein
MRGATPSESPAYQQHDLGPAVTHKGLHIRLVVRMPVEAKPERSAWWELILRVRRATNALARREME